MFVVDGDGVVRYAHRAIAGLTFRSTDELVAGGRGASAAVALTFRPWPMKSAPWSAAAVKAPVTIETITVPDPGPGEALVRVLACGVCHTDLHYREGGINDDFPFLLGHEAAGVVEAVGDGVGERGAGRPGRHRLAGAVRAVPVLSPRASRGTASTPPTPPRR